MYPAIPLLGRMRMVLADTHSTGGGVSGNVLILVPAGIRADICVYAFYCDKTIFASDVEKFVSSRWEHLGLDQWIYLSFGRGPRVWVGKRLYWRLVIL